MVLAQERHRLDLHLCRLRIRRFSRVFSCILSFAHENGCLSSDLSRVRIFTKVCLVCRQLSRCAAIANSGNTQQRFPQDVDPGRGMLQQGRLYVVC
jgi:hypothetical protein